MYNIKIYKYKHGESEIIQYIHNLQSKHSKTNSIKFNKIIAYIRMLRENGLSLGEPYIKHIDNELWELRPIKDRILFAYCEKNTFILLSIFMKQTKKTSKREIEKARKLLKDYKNRSDK